MKPGGGASRGAARRRSSTCYGFATTAGALFFILPHPAGAGVVGPSPHPHSAGGLWDPLTYAAKKSLGMSIGSLPEVRERTPFFRLIGEARLIALRENAMTETTPTASVPAPSFKRAAVGFLTSTACLCLVMVALSSS